MEYNFLCYNFYTLFISYIYSKELRNKGMKCNLILFQYEIQFNNINEGVWDKVIHVDDYNYKAPLRTRIISSIRKSSHINTRRYYGNFGAQALKSVIKNKNDVLVVFKDNDAIFASVIEKFKSITKNNGKIVLIEEGLALYTASKSRKGIYGNKLILKVVRNLIGISIFGTGQLEQGYHPEIDILLAKETDHLDNIQKNNRIIIPQSKGVFSKKNVNSFINSMFTYSDVINKVNTLSKYDYLFIGQPLATDRVCSPAEELDFLRKIFFTLPSSDLILIKPHPREDPQKYHDISKLSSNITILDGLLSELPVEVIYGLLNSNPIVLTAYSSAYKNIQQNHKKVATYLLFKLLNKPGLNLKLSKLSESFDTIIIEKETELASINCVSLNIEEDQEIINEDKLPEIEMLISATGINEEMTI